MTNCGGSRPIVNPDADRPKLSQVVIDTRNARDAAEFWRGLLGLAYRPVHEPPPDGQDDPGGRDWLNLYDADRTPQFAFQQVPALTPTIWPEPHDPAATTS
jgi:hypothetical protein